MARPKPDSLNAPWKPLDPCPCERGLVYKDCCLYADGIPLLQIPNLLPPGHKSGYSHDKCYLNFTNDCSLEISREHYVSKSVLSQFQELAVSGMPWQKKGELEKFNLNNLTAKVLCRRHNSALSPLDDFAGHFFRKIFGAANHVKKRSISNRSAYFLVSGEALELWALKTLLGMFYGKIAQADGVIMKNCFLFKNEIVKEGLFGKGLEDPRGVYFKMETGNLAQETIHLAPLFSNDNQTLNGLALKVSGIAMEFIFDTRGANSKFFQNHRSYYRPWIVDLFGYKRSSRVIMTWKKERKEARRVKINILARNS